MFGRIRQTWQAVFAWLWPVDEALARRTLSESQFVLFQTMTRSDRQHHLRVLKRLRKQGYDHPSLAVAALLHDVGKTRLPITIFDRILAVVVKKLLPQRFACWSQGEPVGWRKAFVVSANHPAWGAEIVATVCEDEMAVWLIAHHQTKHPATEDAEASRLLAALQAADDAS
ncbi:MAG: HD domain-containing protein [Chloroflexi bacterium]|nr:HD domain-containing protein [Chloroflexota bacterium]